MHIRDHRQLNIIIILSFVILAFMNTVELIHFKEIPVFPNGDLCFHWQRILELIRSHHFLPYYDFNSFKNSGSAVMTMYPYLLLYPFAFIYSLVHSIMVTTYWFLGLNTLAALLISYYSSLHFSRSKAVSYLFAVIYSLSFTLFLNTVNSYAVGMNDAFIVMPLVIFGFVYWLKDQHWLMLATGMTALIYSEVLITVFIIVLFIFWALINVRHLQPKHVLNLVKAIILTVLSTAIFWLPAIHLYLNNQLISMGTKHIHGVNLDQALQTAFNIKMMVGPNNIFTMTIYTALGLIVGIASLFYGHRLHKQMYVISILILLFSSNLFPWPALRNTFLNTVQFPWRFYLVPQMILTYLLAEGLVLGLRHVIKSPNVFNQISVTLVILVTGLQLVNQTHYFITLPDNDRGAVINMRDHRILTLNNFEYHDYYPQSINSRFNRIEHHDVMLPNGKSIMRANPQGHGRYMLNSHHVYSRLVMPIITYHGTQYQVEYDSHQIRHVYSRSNLLSLNHVKSGFHQLQIKILPNEAMRISKVMTTVGFIVYLWLLIKWLMRRELSHEN